MPPPITYETTGARIHFKQGNPIAVFVHQTLAGATLLEDILTRSIQVVADARGSPVRFLGDD